MSLTAVSLTFCAYCFTLHVYIVPYGCMLTQLYDDLLRVQLVTLDDDLLRTLDNWHIFGTQIKVK